MNHGGMAKEAVGKGNARRAEDIASNAVLEIYLIGCSGK
jgi:hypothetical protein